MTRKEINKLFDKLNPEEDRKEEIYNKIIDKYNEDTEKVLNKRKRLSPVLVLILVVILSATVFAVGGRYQEFSSNILEWSVSQDAKRLDISARDKGYIINAESVYGDDKNAYLLLSLEREDGGKIRTQEKEGRSNFWIESQEETIEKDGISNIVDGVSNYVLVNPDKDSNKLYFLKKYTTDTSDSNKLSLIGGRLNLSINSINTGYFGMKTQGEWRLEVPLEYESLSSKYEVNRKFYYQGKEAILEGIQISPLDMMIYLKSDQGALEDLTLRLFEKDELIQIKSKVGEIFPFRSSSGGGSNDGSYAYIKLSLEKNYQLEDKNIGYLIIGGVEIPVDLN